MAKTEFIVFGSKPRLHKKELSSISLGGQLFPAKPSVTYLGCCLDSNLDAGSIASKVMSKVNGRSRFLARKAPFVDAVSLRLLANSLVLCCFDYGLGTWYDCLTKALKDELQVSQNRLVRVVLGLTSRDHVGKLQFQQLGWLSLEASSGWSIMFAITSHRHTLIITLLTALIFYRAINALLAW